ncbi:uncharacterized protein LOC143024829 [Oratosquilla oratoria]|uniref:uncharacterized protein LOC143024829 n=1 Tax=Oratosquilla oratoria TaxID=337810 RepID=UPI003F75A634
MDLDEDELGLVLSEEEEEEVLKDDSNVDIYGDLSIGSNAARIEDEEQCLQPENEKDLPIQLGRRNNAQNEMDLSDRDISLENNLYDSILLSTDLEKYRKVIVDLRSQVDTLKMELERTQKLCQDYDADNKILLQNISSLWKVAKADLQRSREEYEKARKEQDAIIFRRAMRQIPRGDIIRIVTQLGNFSKEDFGQFMEMLNGSRTDVCRCQTARWKSNLKGNDFHSPIAQRVNGKRLNPVQFSASGKPCLFTSTPKETAEVHHHHLEKIVVEEEQNVSTKKSVNVDKNDNVQIKEKSKTVKKGRETSGKRKDNVTDSVGDREQRYPQSSRVLRSRGDDKKAKGVSKVCDEGKSKRQSLDFSDDRQYTEKSRQKKKDSLHTQESFPDDCQYKEKSRRNKKDSLNTQESFPDDCQYKEKSRRNKKDSLSTQESFPDDCQYKEKSRRNKKDSLNTQESFPDDCQYKEKSRRNKKDSLNTQESFPDDYQYKEKSRRNKKDSLNTQESFPDDRQYREKSRHSKKDSLHTQETPKGRGKGRRSKRQDTSSEYGNEEKIIDGSENCTLKSSENCKEKEMVEACSPSKDVEVDNHSVVRIQPSRTSRRLFNHKESEKEKTQRDLISSMDKGSQEKDDLEETQQQKADMHYVRGEKGQKERSHQKHELPHKEPQTEDSLPIKDKDLGKSEGIDEKTQSASGKNKDVNNLQENNKPQVDPCEAMEIVEENNVISNNAEANIESSTISEVISESSDQVKDNQCKGKNDQSVDEPEDGKIASIDSHEHKKNPLNQMEERSSSKSRNSQEQEASCEGVVTVLGDSLEMPLVGTRLEDESKAVSESGEESLEEGEISEDSEEDEKKKRFNEEDEKKKRFGEEDEKKKRFGEEDEKKKRFEQSCYTQEISNRVCGDETRKDTRNKIWESNWKTLEIQEKRRRDSGHRDREVRAKEKSKSYSEIKESKSSPSSHKSQRPPSKYQEREKSPRRSRKDLDALVSRQRIGRRATSRERRNLKDYRRKSFPSRRDLGRERRLRESVRDRARRDSVESRHRSPKKRRTPSRDSAVESSSGMTKEKSKKSRKDENKRRTRSPVSKRTGLRSAERNKNVKEVDDLDGRELLEKEGSEKIPGIVKDNGDDTIDFLVSEHHKKYPLEIYMNAEDSESSLLQYIDTSSENIKNQNEKISMYTAQREREITSSGLESSNDMDCLEETLVNVDISCTDADFSFCDRRKEETERTEPVDLAFQKRSSTCGVTGLNNKEMESDKSNISVNESRISGSAGIVGHLRIFESGNEMTPGTEFITEKDTEDLTDSSGVCSANENEVRKTNKLQVITQDIDGKNGRFFDNVEPRTSKLYNSFSPLNSTFSAGISEDLNESLQLRDKVKRKLVGSESVPSKLFDSSCEEFATHSPVQFPEDLSTKNGCVSSQFRGENQSFQDRSESEFCNSYNNSDSSSSSSSDSDSSCSDSDCNCSDSSSCDSSPDKSPISPVTSQPNETCLPLHLSPEGKKSVSGSVNVKESQYEVSGSLHSPDESIPKMDSSCANVEDQTSSKGQFKKHEVPIWGQHVKGHEAVGSRGSCNESTLLKSYQVQTSSDIRGIMNATQPVVVRRRVRRNFNLSCSSSCSSSSSVISLDKRLSPVNVNSIISIVYTKDSKSASTTNSFSVSSPSVSTKSTYSSTSVTTHNSNSPNGATGFKSIGQDLDDVVNAPARKKQKINSEHSIPTLLSTPEKDSPKPRKQSSRNRQTVTSTRTSPRKNSSPSPRRSPRKNYSQ